MGDYLKFKSLNGKPIRVNDLHQWIGENQNRTRNLTQALNEKLFDVTYFEVQEVFREMSIADLERALKIVRIDETEMVATIGTSGPFPQTNLNATMRRIAFTQYVGEGSKTEVLVRDGTPNFSIHMYRYDQSEKLYAPENSDFVEHLKGALQGFYSHTYSYADVARYFNSVHILTPKGKSWDKDTARDFTQSCLVYCGYCRIYNADKRGPFRAYKATQVKRIIPLSLWIAANSNYASKDHDFCCGFYSDDDEIAWKRKGR